MAESRDRLVRTVDLAEVFARRRVGPLGILSEEAMDLLGSPVTRRPTGVAGATVLTARGGGFRRGRSSGTPRFGLRRGRNQRENSTVTPSPLGRGRGGGSGTVLPSWYPRTPLRDITALVRAIEKRRAQVGDGEGLLVGTPVPRNGTILGSNISSADPLEHSFSTPASTSRLKPRPPSIESVSKILLNVTNKKFEESVEEFLTPQKKLLNSIDTVEKAVMVELQKMKRTPSAKKAERQHKVRTLMSMR
ncbi:hypothetical protein V6N13_147348 [Hibiscus sabdariffa]|uniref:Uncharacterized protein n=1 Tax=Hibiscus sabdariffa TaxID=183260 RepID=A0ABR2TVF8_9ROSI